MIPDSLKREARVTLDRRLHPLSPISAPRMSRAELWARVALCVGCAGAIWWVLS